MYYKTIEEPEEIPLENYHQIFKFSDDLIKQITILDISNPKNSKLHLIDTLKELPNFSNWERLVSLKANWHKIEKFPTLPLSIEWVEMETNRVENFPEDLAKYTSLETVNLKDNHMGEVINVVFPDSIRTLELGFNKVHKFESELPEDFGYIGLPYNFISQLPNYITNHPCQKILHHNEGKYSGGSNRYRNNVPTNLRPINPIDYNPLNIPNYNPNEFWNNTPNNNLNNNTTYENGQNVHNSTIMKELRESIKNLAAKIKENNNNKLPNTNILEELYPLLYNAYLKKELERRKNTNRLWGIYYWFKGYPKYLNGKYNDAHNLITTWINNNYTHAGIEYTYSQILSLIIYTIINKEDEEEKHNIIDVLVDETLDSQYVCTTGKFGRLVNVLNGFDDTIEIKLDNNEMINNRLIVIRRKYEDDQDTEGARAEAREMLKEFDLTPQEVDTWVNYIEY